VLGCSLGISANTDLICQAKGIQTPTAYKQANKYFFILDGMMALKKWKISLLSKSYRLSSWFHFKQYYKINICILF
jgi:hypothetical protein